MIKVMYITVLNLLLFLNPVCCFLHVTTPLTLCLYLLTQTFCFRMYLALAKIWDKLTLTSLVTAWTRFEARSMMSCGF